MNLIKYTIQFSLYESDAVSYEARRLHDKHDDRLERQKFKHDYLTHKSQLNAMSPKNPFKAAASVWQQHKADKLGNKINKTEHKLNYYDRFKPIKK